MRFSLVVMVCLLSVAPLKTLALIPLVHCWGDAKFSKRHSDRRYKHHAACADRVRCHSWRSAHQGLNEQFVGYQGLAWPVYSCLMHASEADILLEHGIANNLAIQSAMLETIGLS